MVKKHISVIINKAPYPAQPLLSVEAVWEELQLVSDLEVAEAAFSAARGRLSLQMWVDADHTRWPRGLVTSEVSVLLGSWFSPVKAVFLQLPGDSPGGNGTLKPGWASSCWSHSLPHTSIEVKQYASSAQALTQTWQDGEQEKPVELHRVCAIGRLQPGRNPKGKLAQVQ